MTRSSTGQATALLVVLALVAVAAGCDRVDDATPVPGVTTIRVEDNRFSPVALEVPAGTTLTWEFVGRRDHNVVGDEWGSDVMASGTYDRTFAEPGSYDYTCTLHRGMDGRIIVTDGP